MNQLFLNHVQIIVSIISLSGDGEEAASKQPDPRSGDQGVKSFFDFDLGLFAIDLYTSDVLENKKNRFCYLQHLAMFFMIKRSPKLRQIAKSREVIQKIFKILPEYLIHLNDTHGEDTLSEEGLSVMQLDP